MDSPREVSGYKGWLSYNQCLKLGSSITRQELVSSLPEFSRGTPEDPGSGFQLLDLQTENIEESPLQNISSSITAVQYIEESYSKEKVITEDGEIEYQFAIDEEIQDLYFTEEYLIFRGSGIAESKVRALLAENIDVDLSPVKFHPKFLEWLKYMAAEGKPLTDFLEVQRLTEISYIGGDEFGSQIQLIDSKSVEESAVAAAADGQIESIQADFEVRGYSLRVKLAAPFKIHITTRRGLKDRDQISRLLISLLAVEAIINYWGTWQEGRTTPPETFEKKIIEHSFLSQTPPHTIAEIPEEERDEELSVRSASEFWEYSIEELIRRGENELIEFKHPKADEETLVKELVALANKRGGALLLGVADDGEIIGLEDPGEREESIQNRLDTTVQPRLACELDFAEIDGDEVLVFKVGQFLKLPHSVDDIFYTRRGTTKRRLTPYELSYLMPEREEESRY